MGLNKLFPASLRGKLKDFIRRNSGVEANTLLGALHNPLPWQAMPAGERNEKLVWDRPTESIAIPGEPYPYPPAALRMGYADDVEVFRQAGVQTAGMLKGLLAREQIKLGVGTRAMEWGCASGRVLRHFAEQLSEGCEWWGVDQDSPHLAWARQFLSPPFRFVTCTAYPHLPFADRSFNFVFGISVFTHLVHLVDMWLAEFRRILVPGGLAIFTIHDEETVKYYIDHDALSQCYHGDDIARGLGHDITVYRSRDQWSHAFTYFKADYIRSEWSKFFEIVSLEGRAEMYQTAVVLRNNR